MRFACCGKRHSAYWKRNASFKKRDEDGKSTVTISQDFHLKVIAIKLNLYHINATRYRGFLGSYIISPLVSEDGVREIVIVVGVTSPSTTWGR